MAMTLPGLCYYLASQSPHRPSCWYQLCPSPHASLQSCSISIILEKLLTVTSVSIWLYFLPVFPSCSRDSASSLAPQAFNNVTLRGSSAQMPLLFAHDPEINRVNGPPGLALGAMPPPMGLLLPTEQWPSQRFISVFVMVRPFLL